MGYFDQWQPYDGYHTKEQAVSAAKDLRESLKSYAPGSKVAIRHKPNESLPWVVMVKGRH